MAGTGWYQTILARPRLGMGFCFDSCCWESVMTELLLYRRLRAGVRRLVTAVEEERVAPGPVGLHIRRRRAAERCGLVRKWTANAWPSPRRRREGDSVWHWLATDGGLPLIT